MSQPPEFAIVGHPNKGKSSFVSTLAQDDSVLISPQSGTTRTTQRFPLKIDGKTLYTLVDTPGFQRARSCYEWMQANSSSASDRADTVRKFVQLHQTDDRYEAETQLLMPIMAGAGIIYVVDGSRPYGEEYEIEMEILRWSGQPSMALINLIGRGDYVEEWRTVLNQYFKIVRVFNPLKASFDDRISLLRGFSQLDERWATPLGKAIDGLTGQRQSLRKQSAEAMANLLQNALSHTESKRLDSNSSAEQSQNIEKELQYRYQQKLSQFEARTHTKIESLYQHHHAIVSPKSETIKTELFSSESWKLFGLEQSQLIATSVTGGGLAGGVIDLAVGGHSFFLGAGLGATVAGLTTWLASSQIAKIEILGLPLGGKEMTLGPAKERNFPYVLLSRALLHHQIVESHSHADRNQSELSSSNALLKNQALKARLPFEKLFSTLRKEQKLNSEQHQKLVNLILELILKNTSGSGLS